MNIQELPLKDIFADTDFNCRGAIAPIDVVDLARDIDAHGLQQAIVVQPFKDPQYKYRIVAGYRRHKAFQVLQRETIPCNVVDGLSDVQARIMNLSENLKRKDLNMLQEAKALEHLKNAGLTQDDVAREIGMSRGWTQIRFMILDLPKEIQYEVAAGFLSQQQVRDLSTLP